MAYESSFDLSTINELNDRKNDWTIKVIVVRTGTIETYKNDKSEGEKWKIILADEEGTIIGAILFNDTITNFKSILEKGKTLLLSKALIKKVNPKYRNAHNQYELTINPNSEIKDAETLIPPSIFKSYVSLQQISDDGQNCDFNILAVVVMIKKRATFKPKERKTTLTKMDLVIMDKSLPAITLTLWGDLAINEGMIIEETANQHPIVAITGAIRSIFEGETQISTTTTSTIHINPDLDEATMLRQWMENEKPPLTTPTKMRRAIEATIQDVKENSSRIEKALYCSIKALVLNVQNRDELWYEACNDCSSKVIVTDGIAKCRTCKESSNIAYTPRYMLKFHVGDDTDSATMTLFDAAEMLIGCSVQQFIKSKAENGNKCKYLRRLISCTGKTYTFIIKMDKKNESHRLQGRLTANEIQEDEVKDAKTITINEDDEDESPLVKKIKIEKD